MPSSFDIIRASRSGVVSSGNLFTKPKKIEESTPSWARTVTDGSSISCFSYHWTERIWNLKEIWNTLHFWGYRYFNLERILFIHYLYSLFKRLACNSVNPDLLKSILFVKIHSIINFVRKTNHISRFSLFVLLLWFYFTFFYSKEHFEILIVLPEVSI